jgi:hypothetical protein
MDTSLDDKELPLEAAFFLGKINPDKREAVKFLKQQLWNTSLPNWLRLEAACFLGRIEQRNHEADEDITVIEFLTVQTLENQLLNIPSQVQPTKHTHPLAINLLSFKREREQGALAKLNEVITQKLCNKIYKHQAVKIPGKPPTVKVMLNSNNTSSRFKKSCSALT